ncbi:unnamed protein product [Clonostachys solani]|uniref:MSP domain-containing protein n=1 Tax=Clonostachys solani TaxID=160281 RepID=A0A9N9ZPA3_9HYPO|nr:unnamed protein product [Clonostachys solani]
MSVDIEPLELSFRRPFTVEVSQILTIKNPNTTPVAFKVKTTAPKQYCVRPNSGRIEPGQDFDVTVLLQAMKQEPALDAKCRDKFLVQSAPITGDKEFTSIANVLESTEKGSLQERKIRVNWLPPKSEETPEPTPAVLATPNKQTAINGGAADTPNASQSFSSPAAHLDSSPSTAPPPYPEIKTEEVEEPKLEAIKAAPAPVKAAAAAVVSAATTTATSVKDTVDQELKKRNISSGATATAERPAAPRTAQAVVPTVQGVPVKTTALLCFLAFLIAYLFF